MNATKVLCSATVAAAVTLGAAAALGVPAQQAFAQAHSPPASGTPAAQGQRGQMGPMMAERQKMMAEMAAQEKKLDELVAQMNAAKGAEKIERVAAALTELVAQHKAMHERMMGPGGMMMPQPAPAGTPVPPSHGRGVEQVPPQAHDAHTQHLDPAEQEDEEMCRPPV